MGSPFWLQVWARKERKRAFFDTPDASCNRQREGLFVTRLGKHRVGDFYYFIGGAQAQIPCLSNERIGRPWQRVLREGVLT
jgi:hypothetical protein